MVNGKEAGIECRQVGERMAVGENVIGEMVGESTWRVT